MLQQNQPKSDPVLIRNAMTVDVEDYYHVSAFEDVVKQTSWERFPSRVERNIDSILELFNGRGVKATFFTLGWIAERHPQMIARIIEQGHELASHSWDHQRVSSQTPAQFREDVKRTKSVLEDLSGKIVKGYRAPSYSIGESNLWALDILADTGHVYSSSIVPVNHDHYGMPEAPRFAFRAAGGRLLEIPVSTLPVGGRNINCGGGGWFRLYPYSFSRWALRRVNRKDRQSSIFYFHPWEIDPEQPRLEEIGLQSRFRHYLNLDRMYCRLDRLLGDFEWGRMDDIFLQDESGQ